MSIADLVRRLASAGAPPEAIAIAVEAIEAASSEIKRSRSANAERQKRYRLRHCNVTRNVTPSPKDSTVPSSEPSVPRSKPHPTPYSPPPFVTFWEAYPNKVGKRAAETAFARASKRCDVGEIMLGVQRAKLSRAWSDGYIPHPTTWLNQDRWLDEPSEIATGPPVTGGMLAAASDELGFRRAIERINGQSGRDNGRGQGVVVALPSPATDRIGLRAVD